MRRLLESLQQKSSPEAGAHYRKASR